MYARETEIRHLSSTDVSKLSLELEQSWKKLMRIIPKDLSQLKSHDTTKNGLASADSVLTKYTSDHIQMVEKASRGQNRLATEILLEEWGTSGRIRPNIGNLLDLLVQAEIYRAADYVAINFLNEPPPERPLTGPAAKIDISIPMPTEEIKQIESILNDISVPGTQCLNENAHLGSEMNNKDFYDKFQNDQKRLSIEYSDMMKFSSAKADSCSENESNLQSLNIPNISEMIETKNDIVIARQNNLNDNESNPEEDHNLDKENGQLYENMDDDYEDANVPIISALNVQDLSNDEQQQLSEMNILNGCLDDSVNGPSNAGGETTSNNSRSGSFGNSSSLSTNTDDGSNAISNLSILDQKSNDDSSLTNVTDTSENISFENDTSSTNIIPDSGAVPENDSMLESANVPCLSELNISGSS